MAEIHGVAFGAPQAAEHAGAGALGATQAAASALAAREPAPRVPQWAVDYSSGAIAGMACVAVGHPWDSIKTRLQASRGPKTQSAWSCLMSTLRAEGPRGVYLGLSPRLLGGAAEAAVLMGVYSSAMTALTRPGGAGDATTGGAAGLWARAGFAPLSEAAAAPIAGGVAGAAVSLVLGPSELIKCRMQVSGGRYAGPADCARQLLAAEGPRGLARGLGATMAREVPGNVVYFASYQALRGLLPGKLPAGRDPTAEEAAADAASAIVCGGLAGMALWASIMPIDVAKTRIQTAAGGGARAGIARTLRALYREGGAGKLYAGMSPALARAFPANAAQWLVFEWSCRALERWAAAGAGGMPRHTAEAQAAAH